MDHLEKFGGKVYRIGARGGGQLEHQNQNGEKATHVLKGGYQEVIDRSKHHADQQRKQIQPAFMHWLDTHQVNQHPNQQQGL